MDLLFKGCNFIAFFHQAVRLVRLPAEGVCGNFSLSLQEIQEGSFGRQVLRKDFPRLYRQIQILFEHRDRRLRTHAHKLLVRIVAYLHDAPSLQPFHNPFTVAEQGCDFNALHFTFCHQSVSLLWGIAESYSG